MARQIMHNKLLTCALILTPILSSIGCGDDDGGDDKVLTDAGSDGATPVPGDGSTDGRVTGDGATIDTGVGGDGSVDVDATVRPVGDTWALTSTGQLVLFERATGLSERQVAITNIPAGESIWGADIRPADGAVYALTSAGKLYTIDPATGVATVKSTLAADGADTTDAFTTLTGGSYGVDFNPVADRLRVVSKTGQNLRINVDMGLVTTDGVINPAAALTEAAYTNSSAAACRTRLYVIDADARKLFVQDPPNNGTLVEVGSLGDATLGTIHGFDISTKADGSNVALITVTQADGDHLAEVNLTSGAATKLQPVRNFGGGGTVTSVFVAPPATAPTQLPGELLATTASNKLVSFARGAPGKLCTSVAVTGLAASENIVGADVRPADGNLYALGSTGKLYTVAVATGVATLKSTLAKIIDTDPFTALNGDSFAVAFNPVPDRLRVVSSSGQNLRINVDDGKVTTDSNITQTAGTAAVTAVAYTNAFAGAKSTTLWGLDSTSDSLVVIGANPADGAACPNATNPNCGVSTAVKALGLTGDVAAQGLEVEAANGTVLAALTIGDAASSSLYTLNPNGDLTATPPVPVATLAGVIGGGERVRSLTIATPPKLTAWVITADNKLVSFAPSAPATALSSAALTGLQADETLTGIDVRPSDGKLYGVGSTGRLYALAASGAATQAAALTAAAGATTPFTTLAASTFGFDFNPAADALRVVDRDNHNYRILPSARTVATVAQVAGATFLDADLQPFGSAIVGAGYTNNFAGSTSTTLYVIGGALTTLYTQGGLGGTPSPNEGALASVGALGVNSAFDIGFDVVGGSNGLALAAVDQSNAATLYSVNLSTGAATPFNATANAIAGATGPVRGLALELK